MKKLIYFLTLVQFGLSTPVTVTNAKSGKSLEVEPISSNEHSAKVKVIKSGKTYTLKFDTLTEGSVTKLKDYTYPQPASLEGASSLNDAISSKLFSEEAPLWEEDAADVAKRLGWPKESKTEYSSSYRYYPNKKYGFLNAHPFSATLYGDENGNVASLSLVFANKGDSMSNVGRGVDHFTPKGDFSPPKDLNDAIDQDADRIIKSLSALLSDPTKERYGEARGQRRNVFRWDWNEHSFILSKEDGEYVSLSLVPKEVADNEGKVGRVSDQELRSYLAENVVREENGDVYISNIPMVDQGPKGYCAPATFERAMRYMSVPADMYLLATVATGEGSEGTNTSKLANEAKNIIRSKARRIKELNLKGDLNVKKLSKYIDKGIPVLWQMRSLQKYNDIANQRTQQRSSVEDWQKWATEIQAEAEEAIEKDELSIEDRHHICMVIGYNAETNELAVSDSWGEQFELRWIHADVCEAVTTQGGFIINL